MADPARDQRDALSWIGGTVHGGGLPRGPRRSGCPNWTKVHEELKRRERDADDHVGGASRRVCRRPRIFPLRPRALRRMEKARLSPTMRQTYVAGDKLFVDWAGGRAPIIDPMTGEVHQGAPSLVMVLGASSYTYAEARWSETLPGLDWCARQRARLLRRADVPKAAVPNNPRGSRHPRSRRATSRASTGRTQGISPITTASSCCRRARCTRPRDKAKVEAAVGIDDRNFVLGNLRNPAVSSRWSN